MRALAVALAAAALAACASTGSRIKKHQAQFDSYPPEIQQKIRDGQVEPGFTFEQAEMALGAPDRTNTRTTANKSQEIWIYGRGSGGPRVGFGVGGFTGRHTAVGGGVGVGGGGGSGGERFRIVFEDGRVGSIDRRER